MDSNNFSEFLSFSNIHGLPLTNQPDYYNYTIEIFKEQISEQEELKKKYLIDANKAIEEFTVVNMKFISKFKDMKKENDLQREIIGLQKRVISKLEQIVRKLKLFIGLTDNFMQELDDWCIKHAAKQTALLEA